MEHQPVNLHCENVNNLNKLQSLSRHSSQFSIIHLNIQRAANLSKFDNFKIFIKSMITKPTIICLSETWFLKGTENLYHIPGYTGIFSSRSVKSGGLAMFIENGIEFQTLNVDNGPASIFM